MAKKLTSEPVKGRSLPACVVKTPEAAPPSLEVAQVLEHVSSPYRWELLEVPATKPKKSNVARQKSGQAK